MEHSLPILKQQKIPFDSAESRYMFQPSSDKSFVATPAAIEAFTVESIDQCLAVLQGTALLHKGLDYLQVFERQDSESLWFIEDDAGGRCYHRSPAVRLLTAGRSFYFFPYHSVGKITFTLPGSKEVWKHLESAAARSSHNNRQVFEDFLTMTVASLSGGQMEDGYMKLVPRYSEAKYGDRAIDYIPRGTRRLDRRPGEDPPGHPWRSIPGRRYVR